MSTPALVIDNKVVSMGKVLSKDDVIKALKKVRGDVYKRQGLGCSCHFLCHSLSKREVAASDVMKNTECFGERERKNDTSGGNYYCEKRKKNDSRSGDCTGDCRCGEIPGKPGGERRTALYRGVGHRYVYRYDCECLLQAEQRDSAGN